MNDITIDDWAIIIGGDSHTRMSKGVAFGADSGTVALALATGEASMPIPESVKVTFKGEMLDHMDFRDVVINRAKDIIINLPNNIEGVKKNINQMGKVIDYKGIKIHPESLNSINTNNSNSLIYIIILLLIIILMISIF